MISFFQYLPFNVCVHDAVCENIFTGKTLNNFSSSQTFVSFMIQEALTHRFPSAWMGLEAILTAERKEEKHGKVKKKKQPVRLSTRCMLHEPK